MPIPQKPEPLASQRTLLRDTVRESIKEAILEGTLAPGEDLHDSELQEWLGVSRTPIREAINELVRMGLIETSPNRYTRVANPSNETMHAAIVTIGVLYSGLARLAVPLLTDAQIDVAERGLTQFLEATRSRDYLEMRRTAFPALEIYVEACGNPELQKLCRDSVDGLAFKMRMQRIVDEYDMEQMERDIASLIAATRARDVAGAEAAMSAMFELPPVAPAAS